MARRNWQRSKAGQVYAIEWPEWRVNCAVTGCEECAVVAGLGEAMTIAEAEKQVRESDEMKGWKKRGGLWYCQKHAEGS